MYFLKIVFLVFLAACEFQRIEANRDNARIVLRDTNKKRHSHGCQELFLDLALSTDCEKYARKLAKQKNYTYSDPTNSKYSENICKYKIVRGGLSRCVNDWYRGQKLDFLDPRAKEFTAMIWRSSNFMGYGDATINANEGIMVVRYTPPGNIRGLYTDNVPPKKKHKHKNQHKNCASCQDNRCLILLILFFSYRLGFLYFNIG
ncbi:Golgi-associated plant pathogenesis-related protein 1 [Drosophila elegans]|uniref:Golgi-associated plant pathogenesis-related protein 1 n=1 Tax=Drosophila elegans TaxID=30023 RepID=UPI0007E7CF16|nr:Golgi-associated plant pathogenesis-related protein 1 [Drosophila elegans]